MLETEVDYMYNTMGDCSECLEPARVEYYEQTNSNKQQRRITMSHCWACDCGNEVDFFNPPDNLLCKCGREMFFAEKLPDRFWDIFFESMILKINKPIKESINYD